MDVIHGTEENIVSSICTTGKGGTHPSWTLSMTTTTVLQKEGGTGILFLLPFAVAGTLKVSKSRLALTVHRDDDNHNNPPHDTDVVGAHLPGMYNYYTDLIPLTNE